MKKELSPDEREKKFMEAFAKIIEKNPNLGKNVASQTIADGTGVKRGSIDIYRKAQWRGTIRAAGIGHVRIHDLRHTFASHMAMNGTPLPVLSGLLGHAAIQMTMRYAHLCPDLQKSEQNS